MVLGIIGGSGLLKSAQFLSLVKRGVATEHGSVIIREGTLELASSTCPALSVVFIQRHAADPSCEYSPPHLINYRAIMCALRDRGVTRVLAVCSVGALQEAIPMGALIVPDDYFCPADILAISDGASAHKIPEIDAGLRAQILADLQGAPEGNFEPVDGGVYVQSRGPRFETKAEIRWMAQQGSIIGMTGSHEATLSCEVGLPYAMLCMVDNYANGLVSGIELSLESFHAAQKANLARLENAINVVLAGFAKTEEAAVAKLLAKDGPASAATEKFDTILYPSYIVTVNAENQVLEEHAVGIMDGKIAAIAPWATARAEWSASQSIDLEGQALMPGLVNAHTHTPMVYLRGFGDDLPLTTWLTERIWPAEGKCIGADFVRDGSELAVAEMLKSGTTCFNDMYFFGEETAKVIVSSGIRGVVGATLIEFPSAYANDAQGYLDKAKANLKALSGSNSRLTFAMAPHAPYTVSEAHLLEAFNMAVEQDLPYHLHLHETKQEVTDSVEGNKTQFAHNSDQLCSPVVNLDRLGIMSSRTVAVHMTHLTDEEIEIVSKNKCHVVHCPSSNMKLASGFCPVARLLEAGINVAIGTDGAASNNTLDMFKEMHVTALIAKGYSGDATAVDAATAIRMATINGAKALKLDKTIGSIEVGKAADVIAVDLSGFETQPIYSVVSLLVYSCSRYNVTNVWVEGQRVLNNRKLTTIDEKHVREQVKIWHDHVVESVAQ